MTNKTMISASFEMEVPFFDVDSYRIVWHGNYPKYFEIARCKLLEKIGYSYSVMEDSNYLFPVIDLKTRYVKPLTFTQKINVTASLKEWEHKLIVDYEIHDINSKQLTTKGQTTQVSVLMPDFITQFQSPKKLIDSVNKLIAKEEA